MSARVCAESRNPPLGGIRPSARASYVNRGISVPLCVLHKAEPMVTRAYGPVSPSMDDDVSYVCSRTITLLVKFKYAAR